MGVRNHGMPLVHRQASHRNTRYALAAAGAAKEEGPSVTWIAQCAQGLRQLELAPNNLAFRLSDRTTREGKLPLAELGGDAGSGAHTVKGFQKTRGCFPDPADPDPIEHDPRCRK